MGCAANRLPEITVPKAAENTATHPSFHRSRIVIVVLLLVDCTVMAKQHPLLTESEQGVQYH